MCSPSSRIQAIFNCCGSFQIKRASRHTDQGKTFPRCTAHELSIYVSLNTLLGRVVAIGTHGILQNEEDFSQPNSTTLACRFQQSHLQVSCQLVLLV